MKVCIDARLRDGRGGGIAQVVLGLAYGLSSLRDGDEEYLFLADPAVDSWLRPHVSGPCRILPVSSAATGGPGEWARRILSRRAGGLVDRANSAREARARRRPLPPVPRSDGSIESAGVDIIHFPFQAGFLTDVPSMYHPHDLQHLHLPENFTIRTVALRERLYRALCADATLVVMMSSWGRRDIIEKYGLSHGQVSVVPWGPVLAPLPADVGAIRRSLGLPPRFLFYPAQTFPHKNHLNLLAALAILNQRSPTKIPLVCCGHRSAHFRVIQRRMRELGLGDQVRFLGYRSQGEVRALYALADSLVFPTRFEGWGMPLCEAFVTGTPAACSTATCLPAIAGDAALLFNPEEPEDIAVAIHRLWHDTDLRQLLIERGRRRSELFTLDRAVRQFRALYRQTGRRQLTPIDQELLSAPPLV